MATASRSLASRAKSAPQAAAGPVLKNPSQAQAHHAGALPSRPSHIPAEAIGSMAARLPVERKRPIGSASALPFSGAPPSIHPVLRSPGEPLDLQTRQFMEPRFGRDFSSVRLHTDSHAADSARSVNAMAYTAGDHLVFNQGRYAPETVSGRRLLIHELAHVAQQGNRPAPLDSNWQLSSASSPTERAADEAVSAVERGLRMPGAILASQLAGMAPSQPILHRAVATWGGEWDTTKYEELPTKDGIKQIELHFKPKDPVDATKISIVQKVSDKSGGTAVFPDNTVKARSLTSGSDSGASIDAFGTNRNPLYPTNSGVSKATDNLFNSQVDESKGFGNYGFHHQDAKGVMHEKDAVMGDAPSIGGAGANSSQLFEDTALAVTGVQAGATYGSVQWGWKKDAAGTFAKLPLTKLSDDAPTGNFKAAQVLWNNSKDAAGNDNIKFFTASGKFIQDDNTPLVADPADAAKTEIAKLPKDTRVEMIDIGIGQKFNRADPKVQWNRVSVTEGPQIGKTGWVLASQLANTKAKAPAAAPAP
jgi:hypothetical protein